MPRATIKTDLDVLDLVVEIDRMDTVDKVTDAMSEAFRSFGYETLNRGAEPLLRREMPEAEHNAGR